MGVDDMKGEYYGKMSVMSICSSTKYVSILRGDGDVKSNDRRANIELSVRLPEILDRANYYVYDLERSK